jgi:hypothetical protein
MGNLVKKVAKYTHWKGCRQGTCIQKCLHSSDDQGLISFIVAANTLKYEEDSHRQCLKALIYFLDHLSQRLSPSPHIFIVSFHYTMMYNPANLCIRN